MKYFLLITALISASSIAGVAHKPDAERAKQLKEYLHREKPSYDKRESQRKDTLEDLDRLNADQNRVRQRIGRLEGTTQELNMALDNMTMEVQKQRHLEMLQKKRITMLMKMAYKIKKDGVMRFMVRGENLSDLAGRVRILYRTLRSHSAFTKQLSERSERLAESEQKLSHAKAESQTLLEEMSEQEMLLNTLLEKKKTVLHDINQKQNYYTAVAREYRQIATQLKALFENFESGRDTSLADKIPSRGTLPLPLSTGIVVKSFGRSVHEKFPHGDLPKRDRNRIGTQLTCDGDHARRRRI